MSEEEFKKFHRDIRFTVTRCTPRDGKTVMTVNGIDNKNTIPKKNNPKEEEAEDAHARGGSDSESEAQEQQQIKEIPKEPPKAEPPPPKPDPYDKPFMGFLEGIVGYGEARQLVMQAYRNQYDLGPVVEWVSKNLDKVNKPIAYFRNAISTMADYKDRLADLNTHKSHRNVQGSQNARSSDQRYFSDEKSSQDAFVCEIRKALEGQLKPEYEKHLASVIERNLPRHDRNTIREWVENGKLLEKTKYYYEQEQRILKNKPIRWSN